MMMALVIAALETAALLLCCVSSRQRGETASVLVLAESLNVALNGAIIINLNILYVTSENKR